MYIDTHSKESMESSICSYFNITKKILHDFFHKAPSERVFRKLVWAYLPKKKIDQILFFHLSRRLDSAQDSFVGYNLFELLSTKNALSEFLNQHGVYFSPCEGHLNLYHKGNLIPLELLKDDPVPYLRWRLGYIETEKDFCFNGFAFKDLLYSGNGSIQQFRNAPEFVNMLAMFLKRPDLVEAYFRSSKYYCFEYCVPIDSVQFDDVSKISLNSKKIYLVNQVLHRLYDYFSSKDEHMHDDDNPVLRLPDNENMPRKYFVKKEIIP
ncbi:hypothetical protein [Christensenella hongkongensis]|uniref:Uncharacterized protein n=1 Tax=Christensenella hongkongensis TaxID=270498 RepID=A0A0M2NJP1_9FIRM|nr:hypothetical protein [Christensenella hongkongensis]KKI50465.1 hypothetical protein CHK_2057 [Christensenella hongkongensis]TCW27209.1 hypothetical protein EV208_11266 [Christensenella hongkongensis]